jgi:hypothetical protein
MNPDLDAFFPEHLSDEAAFALYDLLQHLTLAWESRYFVQLRRHQGARQIDLFDPDRPWRTAPTDP